MQDLRMEVILFRSENTRYNRDADILAQFLNGLRARYPQMIISEYDGNIIEQLSQHVHLDYYDQSYPVFILNGHIVSSGGVPDIKDIDKYIEEVL